MNRRLAVCASGSSSVPTWKRGWLAVLLLGAVACAAAQPPNNPPAIGYIIERRDEPNGPWKAIAVADADAVCNGKVCDFKDRNAKPARTYWYRVRAISASGDVSPPSQPVEVTTPGEV